MKLKARHLAPVATERYRLARSVYIHGARQTGKTTLARMVFPRLPYVSLEAPDMMAFAREDPRDFLARHPGGAILDEVQRAPELLSYLQGIIDREGSRWILTGSQNFLLMEKVSQSLAGRIAVLELPPLSQREIRDLPWRDLGETWGGKSAGTSDRDRRSIEETILRGGYPEMVVQKGLERFWFGDYLRTCVERDIRQIINVQDTTLFQRFFGLCAGRSGSLLNLASLAGDTGISQSNCRRWLSLLQIGSIVFLLPPYHRNFNKRLTKSPKLYFNDTGLLCSLLNIKTPDELRFHPLAGQIFETFVVAECRKILLNEGEDRSLFFWRDNHGTEIDLVLESGREIFAVEIKRATTYSGDFAANLGKFATYAQGVRVHTHCVYGGDESFVRQGVGVRSWREL